MPMAMLIRLEQHQPILKRFNRQSSALIDVQNQQTLRPSVDRDTLYIGANTTKRIDLKKIFGPEKRVNYAR